MLSLALVMIKLNVRIVWSLIYIMCLVWVPVFCMYHTPRNADWQEGRILVWFAMEDMHNNFIIVVEGVLNLKANFYKFYYFPIKDLGPTTFLANIDDQSRIWHERREHLNFQSMKLMVKHGMVVGIPKVVPPYGVCKGCVLGKHY